MKFLRQYGRSLFWLGPILVVVGLSAGVVAGWGAVPVGIAIAGGVLTGIGLLFASSATPGFWGRRSTQSSTNALVATLSVLVILGLVNFLGARYVQRIDLTENQQFTLAPETQQVVRNLQRPVKVVVFDKQPNATLRTLLEQYRKLGDKFSFEFVDPDAKPSQAAAFNLQNGEYGLLFLQSGDRKQFLQNVQTEKLSESRLTNGLQQISADRQSKVYFLQGHGEHPLEQAQQGGYAQAVAFLQEKNFTSEPLNLVEQKTVPQDASVVVVAGAKQALFEGEVKALTEYLDRGGSTMLLIDPNTDPKLDSLLKDWNVSLDSRVVINASQQQIAGLGAAAVVVNQYGEHPITKEFGNRYSFFPLARAVDAKPAGEIKVIPLLSTTQQTWAESDVKDSNLQFNPDRDRPGPLTLGFALSRPVKTAAPASQPETQKSKPEARLVVIGNSAFAVDGFFDKYLNGDVFLNAISWLSKRDDQVLSIRPKEIKNRRINLNNQQASLVSWTAIGVLPFLAFTTAIYLWWRRR
ncbi:MAG: Gldg family protein [Scytolyngbya sp. HA4215-MV1]|nr:Gldg family protein [Scytolyngbya sp. HA4215-MV1]